MADANRLIEIQLRKIKSVIYRGCKIILSQRIKDRLIEKVFENFYDRYEVGDAGWLIDSLAIKVTPVGNMESFNVQVLWKDRPLKHTSWWGSESLSVAPGDMTYTVEWINSGYTFLPNGDGRRINDIGDVKFIEGAIEELEFDNSWINEFYSYLRNNGIDIV